MGMWYKADGTSQEVHPAVGKKFKLIELQKLVGGYIEVINLKGARHLVVNEDGHPLGLKENKVATQLYHGACIPGTTHQIVGDAVFLEPGEY